jgi:hypothetical protein
MDTVIADFERRVSEIDLYFQHLEAIEEKDGKLSVATSTTRRLRNVNPELVKVLKANLFLLLYNLAESSIRQAITELLDTISSERITYSQAADELKRLWIDVGHCRFKNRSAQEIFGALEGLPNDIIDIPFRSEMISGGNIDGRKIREFGTVYGFSCKTHRNANEGVKLFNVKRLRNDLAHGLVSFGECGRNYTVSDLRAMKREVIMYLRGVLRNVGRYINARRFRA